MKIAAVCLFEKTMMILSDYSLRRVMLSTVRMFTSEMVDVVVMEEVYQW